VLRYFPEGNSLRLGEGAKPDRRMAWADYPPFFLFCDGVLLTFLYIWILYIHFIRLPKEKPSMKTNYVILYSGGKMPESESEQKAILQDWENWYSG
jgi:hypothetical protein